MALFRRKRSGGDGDQAAWSKSDKAGIARPKAKPADLSWEQAEQALLQADLGVAAAARIIQLAQSDFEGEVFERVCQALVAELTFDAPASELEPEPNASASVPDAPASAPDAPDAPATPATPGPEIWLVVGVNGVGKTTTVAKLAQAQQNQGRQVVLVAADTFRAAAIDQLQIWADQLGVPLVKGAPGGDPAAVVFDAAEHAVARQADLVIADTAGRMHTKGNLMEELKKVVRVARKSQGTVTEILLVIDSTTGQNGISQARIFHENVQPSGIVLTKLDGSSKGGVVVSVQQDLGLPVKFIGTGEAVSDLRQFDPAAFAEALLGQHQ